MRKLTLILILTISFNAAFCQLEMRVIDIDMLIEKHPRKHHYDSLYQMKEKSKIDSMSRWQSFMSEKYQWGSIFDNYPDSLLNTEEKKKKIKNIEEKKLNQLIDQMKQFQKDAVDELKRLEENNIQIIKEDIYEQTKIYSQEHNYNLILDKKSINYYNPDLDVTLEILELIKNKKLSTTQK